MMAYRIDGNYLRCARSLAYIACFQEGATDADRALIKSAPKLLAVLEDISKWVDATKPAADDDAIATPALALQQIGILADAVRVSVIFAKA